MTNLNDRFSGDHQKSVKGLKQYNSIDLVKFIASLFIVGLHSHILLSFSERWDFNFQVIARFAVPYFFISSSFFFFKKLKISDSYSSVVTYCKRICRMYLFWFILYIPLIFYLRIWSIYSDTGSWIDAVCYFVREALFSSTFPGSWFLTASMYAAILVPFFLKKFAFKTTLAIALVIYLLPLIAGAYNGLFPEDSWVHRFITGYEFVFSIPYFSWPAAILYFVIGKYFADHENRIRTYRKLYLIVAVCLCIVLSLIEENVLYYYHIARESDVFISLIPLSVFLFAFVLNMKIEGRQSTYLFLRKASIVLYFTHFGFVYSYIFLNRLYQVEINSALRFVVIVVFGLLITIVVDFLRKKTFPWLKYVY